MGLGCLQVLGITIGSVIGLPNSSIAQTTPEPITSDGTLPNNSRVTLEENRRTITGGTQAGRNLFHSFKKFSVPTGSEAFFNNGADIQNIINRVTGGSISNIDSLIRANGSANLFLINPNGIVFGQNARLDIGGSFFATSANSMKFADGSEFSAKNPQSTPLLTIDVPIGLQFGANPGSIQVKNTLQVQPGKTLGLVGGNIDLEGATLEASGGRIELGSVAENSLVNLTPTNPKWLLGYQNTENFRNIHLVDNTNILVNGDGKGSIAINANNIDIHSGSNIQAGIDADFQILSTQAGDIALNASGIISVNKGRIVNEVGEGGIGNAGNINIVGQAVFLNNNAALSTNSFGRGNTGNISINARDTFSFDGADTVTDSFISASVFGTGNGGKIAINAPKISLSNKATIVSHSYGLGNAGNISINTPNALTSSSGSSIASLVFPGSVGNGGIITVNSPKVYLLNGATIVAHTYSQGNAGDIIINANKVLLDGVHSDGASSGLGSAAFESASGNGGSILVDTNSLNVTNGASLFASSYGKGDAGRITINATDAVSFDGVGANGLSSNALTAVELGSTGNAREINITANSLSVGNGAVVGASTLGQGKGGDININVNALQIQEGGMVDVDSTGQGNAGSLNIDAKSIRLDKNGTINANTRSPNKDPNNPQANINVRSQDLILRRGSNITASATGENVIGGNIDINTEILAGFENSDVAANSENFRGGNITINAEGIFGMQFRDIASDFTSDITATGANNELSGNVEITTPEVDPSSSLVELPGNLVDASNQISKACTPGGSGFANSFISTGRGGLPMTPTEPLQDTSTLSSWVKLKPQVLSRRSRKTSSQLKKVSNTPKVEAKNQIVEATGWIIDKDGNIEFVAQANQTKPKSSWQNPASCSVSQ